MFDTPRDPINIAATSSTSSTATSTDRDPIRRVNTLIDPKKIAKFCFLVILCYVWCSLQHTKNRTKSKIRKVSNFEVDFIDF